MVGDDASEGDSVNVAVEEVAGDAADRGKVIVEHGQAHGGHQLWKIIKYFHWIRIIKCDQYSFITR